MLVTVTVAAAVPSAHQPMPYTGDVKVRRLQQEISQREQILAQTKGQGGGEWLQQQRLETARSNLTKLLGPTTASLRQSPPPVREGLDPHAPTS